MIIPVCFFYSLNFSLVLKFKIWKFCGFYGWGFLCFSLSVEWKMLCDFYLDLRCFCVLGIEKGDQSGLISQDRIFDVKVEGLCLYFFHANLKEKKPLQNPKNFPPFVLLKIKIWSPQYNISMWPKSLQLFD